LSFSIMMILFSRRKFKHVIVPTIYPRL
jgi:hypothetical protein